jgi:hypothetical protein
VGRANLRKGAVSLSTVGHYIQCQKKKCDARMASGLVVSNAKVEVDTVLNCIR